MAEQIISEKSKGVAAVLCFFLGFLGIHRFYAGKVGTGILWMCTGGFLSAVVLGCVYFEGISEYIKTKFEHKKID